ncbi:MAG: hypothetical protein IPL77_14185 [Flavobacteriales bacterium]|nr:hypothetical protein [Flavobacteriales bacterium]
MVHPGDTLCNVELGSFFDCCQNLLRVPERGGGRHKYRRTDALCGTPSNAWWTLQPRTTWGGGPYASLSGRQGHVSSFNPPNTTNTNTFVTI